MDKWELNYHHIYKGVPCAASFSYEGWFLSIYYCDKCLQYLIKFAWCFVSFWSLGLFSLLRVESSANPRVTDKSSGGRALDTSQAFQENQPRAASRRLSELLCWLISTPLASRGLFLSDMDSKWPQNLTLNWLFQSYHLNDCFLLSGLLRELIYR